MKNILYLSLSTFLLFSCSSKEGKELYKDLKQKKQYHRKILNTERIIIDHNGNKTLLTGTYLKQNHTKNNKTQELFIFGLNANEEYDDNRSINKSFHVRLNGKKPVSIKKIDKNNALLKDVSFISNWTDIYYIKFPYIDNRKLTLDFKSKYYGNGTLHFAKVPRYIFEKKKSIF